MDREEQGKRRAGKITGTCAHTIANGNAKTWATLSKRLWADDGSVFSATVGGSRGYGISHEDEGAAKFWMKHPEFELENVGYVDYTGVNLMLRQWLGVSPDRLVKPWKQTAPVAGLEVKSPTRLDTFDDHLPSPKARSIRKWKHFAQCQHGMLVTGLPIWYFVVHFGEEHYRELVVEADMEWRQMYINRLGTFIRYHDLGKGEKRKVRVSDILDA